MALGLFLFSLSLFSPALPDSFAAVRPAFAAQRSEIDGLKVLKPEPAEPTKPGEEQRKLRSTGRAKQFEGSSEEEAEDLARLIHSLDTLLRTEPLASSRVGLQVLSLDSGKTLYSHNVSELLNPASNVKLVTAAAALHKLGPEYRFPTEFWCSGQRASSCGTLYIKGHGDPMLYTERVYGIANQLLALGLAQVSDIVVDDTWFDEFRGGPGWDQENVDRPYLAPAGALSINHNAVAIHILPASTVNRAPQIRTNPASAFFRIENNLRSVTARSRRYLVPSSIPDGNHQRIRVTGRLPVGSEPLVFYRKIDNPPFYAGETFKTILQERGIAVKGRVRLGVTPDDASLLYTAWSPSLAEVVRELNKYSNNFIAEQLIKTLGAEFRGAPGSWEKGISVVEEVLAEMGIMRGSYVMKNGSGLNDINRFSAAQLAHLLKVVWERASYFPEFAASLGIAAKDGTLRSRLDGTQAQGLLRGKTGTLQNVSALSGYVRSPRNERLAYVILVNDFSGPHHPVVGSIDLAAANIAGLGHAQAWNNEEVPSAVESQAEMLARARTFAGLAKLKDRRNLSFLRSSLRTEQEPLIRAVIADAVYQSTPHPEPELLLDNLPTEAEQLSWLHSLGQELAFPTPMVASIIDLASEGNVEALEALVAMAGLILAEDEANSLQPAKSPSKSNTLDALFVESFEEVGRSAPDALFETLRRANTELAERAVEFLGRGIAVSPEGRRHPFLSRLKEPTSSGERSTAIRLYERIEGLLTDFERAAHSEAGEGVGSRSSAGEPGSFRVPGSGALDAAGGG